MNRPLADILRPNTLDEFIGQSHLIGSDSILRHLIQNDMVRSAIFYGPPGTGKTTLANIIAQKTSSIFMKLNAVAAGVKDIRAVIKSARTERDINGHTTIVMADEIHRWQRNVQDALLPSVEDGTIVLIGATTQNPYFSLIPALISRSHIYEFKSLNYKDMAKLIKRALDHYRCQGLHLTIARDAIDYLIEKTSGDARKLIMSIEVASTINNEITKDLCSKILPHKSVIYDKDGDGTYDILSAIQGAVQASDVHGAIFWLARAINSGENLEVICRRLLVTASEDVGCCNPMALVHTHAAVRSAMMVGFPEASIILSSAVAYLAMNPRSKASCTSIHEALELDKNHHIEIPSWLRDCHYRGADALGRGSYHDGQNQSVYKPIIRDLFMPENGEEIVLMQQNDKYWNKLS